MCERNRGAERRVRDADHHGHAAVGELDGAADQVLPFFEIQMRYIPASRLRPRRSSSRAAILDDVVDLARQRGLIDREIGGKRGEWRDNQSRLGHGGLPDRLT